MAITKRCPNCGQSISADSAFCTYCGHPISDAISRPTMNQKKKSSHLGLKIAVAIIAVLAALFAVVAIKWYQEGEIARQGTKTLEDMAGDTSYDPFTGPTD